MTEDWWLPALAGLLVLVAVVLTVALLRLRARTRAELATARAESAALRSRLDELAARVEHQPTVPSAQEFRITSIGEPEPLPSDLEPMDRQHFTDVLLRESVVRVGSLAHGVRRALRPEVRNRIRFEVRREVKRSRKLRKDEIREAVREWRARQRAGVDDDLADDVRSSA